MDFRVELQSCCKSTCNGHIFLDCLRQEWKLIRKLLKNTKFMNILKVETTLISASETLKLTHKEIYRPILKCVATQSV